jgi:nucleoid-associated protein YgaU
MKASLLKQIMLVLMFGFSLALTNCASTSQQDEEYLEQGEQELASTDTEEYEQQGEATESNEDEMTAEDDGAVESPVEEIVEDEMTASTSDETEELVPEVVEETEMAASGETAEKTETWQAKATPATDNGWTEASSFEYTIVKGDTLTEVAQKVYGAASKWKTIAQASSVTNPDFILTGHVLKIPLINDTARQFSSTYTPTHTASNTAVRSGTTEATELVKIIVKKGETLSSIAQAELGNSAAWATIYEDNKANIPDPNRLTVGQVLNVRRAQAH